MVSKGQFFFIFFLFAFLEINKFIQQGIKKCMIMLQKYSWKESWKNKSITVST